ncbi:putative nuclease HARBI1 [Pseudomyrmex gracilis]|uniref:putative nuclease HARBI1 n=1 Tax=Pseudomyrmex gracilis TaxID=219809 RepID=UPI000995A975|nr:putative nuclease HARBI1 [Pseudomyrmex gracilis]
MLELENTLMPLMVEDDIPFTKKILLSIWILATPDSFRSVADRFGLPKTAAYNAFSEVVKILKNLMREYIKWPNADDYVENSTVFYRRSRGFPGVIGAIDGCHIQIKQPPGNANDYYNRKGFHSIILQGTCDHSGKFIDVLIGRPGRAHDAAVFRSSPLYTKLTDEQNHLLPPDKHIIADSAYPLLQNVMTPFKDNGHLSEMQSRYNAKLSSIRSIIERAFGLLKGKFRRLRYLDVRSVMMGNLIIAAACTLHNFILLHEGINIRDNINIRDDVGVNNDVIDDGDVNVEENENARQKRIEIMNLL